MRAQISVALQEARLGLKQAFFGSHTAPDCIFDCGMTLALTSQGRFHSAPYEVTEILAISAVRDCLVIYKNHPPGPSVSCVWSRLR